MGQLLLLRTEKLSTVIALLHDNARPNIAATNKEKISYVANFLITYLTVATSQTATIFKITLKKLLTFNLFPKALVPCVTEKSAQKQRIEGSRMI